MRISGVGHGLFAVSIAGIALLALIYRDFAPLVSPLPASLPWRDFWAYASGAILLAASGGLLFTRTAAASTALVGAYGLIWLVSRARVLIHAPLGIGTGYGIAEALEPLIGAWILWELLRRQSSGGALRLSHVLFGLACVIFGAAHVAFAPFTAAMVPSWLPGPMALAYLTGAAHAAAGLALVIGLLPQLAATLEATMMTLFGVLVWLPSFFARPAPEWAVSPQNEWSETCLSFLLAASAWIVAASLKRAAHEPLTPVKTP
jgi:uncharacterized membrane protein